MRPGNEARTEREENLKRREREIQSRVQIRQIMIERGDQKIRVVNVSEDKQGAKYKNVVLKNSASIFFN